jgi:hypothetical protein
MKTVTEGAALIAQEVDKHVGTGRINGRVNRAARKQSKDVVFNLACWLKYSMGACLSGEEDIDWMISARDILKVVRGS